VIVASAIELQPSLRDFRPLRCWSGRQQGGEAP